MYRLAYRNFGSYESLVVNHCGPRRQQQAQPDVGIRWYELRSSGTGSRGVFQQSTFAPDSTFRWMGSVAMDKQGNMALGYSASSSSVYPSLRYTGRLVSDPLSMMQSEGTLKSGSGSQLANLSRWGDYSAHAGRPRRRLHVLVHQRVPEGERHLQLEHLDRLVQARRLQLAGAQQRQQHAAGHDARHLAGGVRAHRVHQQEVLEVLLEARRGSPRARPSGRR